MRRIHALTLLTVGLVVGMALPAHAQLSEDFQNVAGLVDAGWVFQNNSSPAPTTNNDWGQGNTDVFFDRTGTDDSYVAASFESVGEPSGTISNWLLTPMINVSNGDTISFYTRTTDGVFPDRLEVRLSLNGASSNVGATAFSVGDFTRTLLTINPDLLPGSENYPTTFTQFSIALTGLPQGVNIGRIGFRYFVTDSGLEGVNGDFIGIDTLQIGISPATPEPSSVALVVLGVGIGYWVFGVRRRGLTLLR